MKRTNLEAFGAAVLGAALLLSPSSAHARNGGGKGGGNWAQDHPARAEDNHELREERGEIRHDVQDGSLTKAQGQEEMKDIRDIHKEEVTDASQNGGHLTAAEQKNIQGQIHGVQSDIKADGGQTRRLNPGPAANKEWLKDHPRAAKDLQRLGHERRALKQELASGKIDQATYNKEMHDLNQDAMKIRSDANSGGINAAEQKDIRGDLREDGKEIRSQEGGTTTPPPPVTPPTPVAAPAAAQ